MSRRRTVGRIAVILLSVAAAARPAAAPGAPGPLDPRGKVHIPIGVPDTLDALKTFVEAEGVFSPGVGSYGVYCWVYDHDDKKLYAPTAEGTRARRGLAAGGLPIPWTEWEAGDLVVTTELCEVRRPSERGTVFVVGSRVSVRTRAGAEPRNVSLYVAVRGLGPAGWPVRSISIDGSRQSRLALVVDGHPAVVPDTQPDAAGVCPTDTIGQWASEGSTPPARAAESANGDCSGALRFDLAVGDRPRTVGLVCPVLPGRRAVAHRWDGKSDWAQLDEAAPNPAEGGKLQPDPGLAYYRNLGVDVLFEEARKYWTDFLGGTSVDVPDRRWGEAFAAITAHAALAMNDGAPDVSVVNYNVFNRDGVYTTNILQKVARFDLAEKCVDYFLAHPFNGRVVPEADNPGQVLWVIGEHWKFTRDRDWLARVYPSVRKLAAMIEYYRTTPGPHWVGATGLDFGDQLAPQDRRELEPGRCDGYNPAYTEAFDLAGLRAAADLAKASDEGADLSKWTTLASTLSKAYDGRYGENLRSGYGGYCVLWPCRLYSFDEGRAHEQFKAVGMQEPHSWRYFPLATAHQGLLAGNRAAAFETIDRHLAHEQMAGGADAGAGWYAFDEGGRSGPGGWHHLRTTWDKDVAMPHGWAIAELHLLVRDALAYEDGDTLVLLAGVPPNWFRVPAGPQRPHRIKVTHLPTHFGPCSFTLKVSPDGASTVLDLPAGVWARDVVVCVPPIPGLAAWTPEGAPLGSGRVRVPPGVKQIHLRY